MQVLIELNGTTPLLMHDIRAADPDHPLAKQMAAITAKRKRTEEDRIALARLKFEAGLYIDNGSVGPYLPASNIRKCLIGAATVTREGKAVGRAVQPLELVAPLTYEGPRTIDALWAANTFTDVQMVKVGTSRVPAVRPIFRPPWSARLECELLTNILDFESLVNIVELAGRIEGICDNRTNGYGRFVGTVKEV